MIVSEKPATPIGATGPRLRFIPNSWTRVLQFQELFGRPTGPIEADLGCGKGRFLRARAKNFPNRLFLGIDAQLLRIEKVERDALRDGLSNIRLLYAEIHYTLGFLLPPASLAAVYLFFPDPWPKRKHLARRLFDSAFIAALARTLTADGCIHIATDHLNYFRNISRNMLADSRFQPTDPYIPAPGEESDFGLLFARHGRVIHRCSFRLRPPQPP